MEKVGIIDLILNVFNVKNSIINCDSKFKDRGWLIELGEFWDLWCRKRSFWRFL